MDSGLPFCVPLKYIMSSMSRRGVPGYFSGLNMDEIVTYVRPRTDMKASWDDVPQDIKDTFDRLGIPGRRETSLAGSVHNTIRKWSITTSAKSW